MTIHDRLAYIKKRLDAGFYGNDEVAEHFRFLLPRFEAAMRVVEAAQDLDDHMIPRTAIENNQVVVKQWRLVKPGKLGVLRIELAAFAERTKEVGDAGM